MARVAILALTALVAASALFSGCLSTHASVSPGGPTASSGPDALAPADGSSPAGPSVPAKPPCPDGSNNYGVDVTIGDLYVKSGTSKDEFLVVYQESNGCRGLQTEGRRPEDPDHKIAEVPNPLAAPAPVASASQASSSGTDCGEHTNANGGTWFSGGGLYVISPYDGKLLVVYQEANGIRGIQTETQCPDHPDLRILEVAEPLAPTEGVQGASANA